MATIREAFDYAAKNPNSDFAKNLAKLAASGSLDVEARKNGIDLTPFKPATTEQVKLEAPVSASLTDKKTVPEKILGFTGGDTLAKGAGQALADTNVQLGGLAPGESVSSLMGQVQKGQGEQQSKLIQAIRTAKAQGKDTTRLEKALTDLTGGIAQTGNTAEQLLNPNQITNKQVLGDALQLATTIGTAGSLPGAASEVGAAKTVGQGIIQGAKIGAKTGAIAGGASGVASGLKNDLTAEEIAKQGALGVAGGAALGGVLGGVSGGISGGIQGAKASKLVKEENFVKDLVSPKLTEKVKEQALAEGRVTEAGLLKKSAVLPGKRDKQLAEVVKNYVSSKKPITENIDSVKAGVKQINEGVKDYVKANKVPFNTKQLASQLNKGKDELNLIFASDSNAEKTYNAVVKEFLKGVDSKDTAGLLARRQEFDKIPAIKKLLDSQGLGENTKKEVVLTVRDMANRYIAKLLPEGNAYRSQLLQESKMIEALGNMTEKNTGMIGQNKLQMLTKEYPILKWLIGGAATGVVGAAGVGVGSSIIGSSD